MAVRKGNASLALGYIVAPCNLGPLAPPQPKRLKSCASPPRRASRKPACRGGICGCPCNGGRVVSHVTCRPCRKAPIFPASLGAGCSGISSETWKSVMSGWRSLAQRLNNEPAFESFNNTTSQPVVSPQRLLPVDRSRPLVVQVPNLRNTRGRRRLCKLQRHS